MLAYVSSKKSPGYDSACKHKPLLFEQLAVLFPYPPKFSSTGGEDLYDQDRKVEAPIDPRFRSTAETPVHIRSQNAARVQTVVVGQGKMLAPDKIITKP